MTTNHVSLPIGSYLRQPPPPPAADAEPCSDSHYDRDQPVQKPEFVMHAIDDRCLRAPAAGRLPIEQPPPTCHPVRNWEREAAARTERLQYHMLLPQVVICVCILFLGSMMIYYAANPEMIPDPKFTWLIVFSALIMLLSLLPPLLSHLGVNVYENQCPASYTP